MTLSILLHRLSYKFPSFDNFRSLVTIHLFHELLQFYMFDRLDCPRLNVSLKGRFFHLFLFLSIYWGDRSIIYNFRLLGFLDLLWLQWTYLYLLMQSLNLILKSLYAAYQLPNHLIFLLGWLRVRSQNRCELTTGWLLHRLEVITYLLPGLVVLFFSHATMVFILHNLMILVLNWYTK